MEYWTFLVKTFMPCCYILLTIAILRNITVLTVTDCPSTAIIEKPVVIQNNYILRRPLDAAQKNDSPQSITGNRRVKNFPACIIIGVRKGGTRALLDAVGLHPQIKIVRHEMHFFDSNETYQKGLEWYRSQMPFTAPSQIGVEKTPGYFSNEFSPQRIYEMNPSIKLILIVRDPVVRAISDYTQVMCMRQEQNKTPILFEESAFLEDGYTINADYKPIRNSLYSLHMSKWLKYFPLENFLIVDAEKFVTKPLVELRRVERFLHLPHLITEDQLVYDERKHFYCFRRKNRLKAKCLGSSKGRPHANISLHTRMILKKNFHRYNQEFFKMVNRLWPW